MICQDDDDDADDGGGGGGGGGDDDDDDDDDGVDVSENSMVIPKIAITRTTVMFRAVLLSPNGLHKVKKLRQRTSAQGKQSQHR